MARRSEQQLDAILQEDREILHKLGYAQQLYREMGGFSNFALSFSIISILTGTVLLYGYGLKYGGPAINTVGWPIVSVFVLCVAASMAELASAYPTAGGLYFWSYRLGGRTWAWTCAWFNLIGQITITAGINIGAAAYMTGLITDAFAIPNTASVPILGPVNGWNFWLVVMVLLTIPQIIINIRGIRMVSLLSDFSLVWHIGGVILLAMLLTFAGRYHNGWAFLLSTQHPVMPSDNIATFAVGPFTVPSVMLHIPGMRALYGSGIYAFSFMLGLLQAQWTYTGFDASAHMAEETFLARMNAAWGVFLSVAVSAIVGYVALLVLTSAIPPGKIAATVNDPYPVLFIVRSGLRPLFANMIAVIIAVAMWLCGLGSITSMARMCFAFARDRGFPGGESLSEISRWRTPANAIVATSVAAIVITFYSAAYTVVTSISVSALYLAYGIPIYLNWRNKLRGAGEFTTPSSAPWTLGKFGSAINLISIIWIVFISVLFSIPPNELAGLSIILLGVVLVAYWRLSQRHRFQGPQPATAQEIAKIEASIA